MPLKQTAGLTKSAEHFVGTNQFQAMDFHANYGFGAMNQRRTQAVHKIVDQNQTELRTRNRFIVT